MLKLCLGQPGRVIFPADFATRGNTRGSGVATSNRGCCYVSRKASIRKGVDTGFRFPSIHNKQMNTFLYVYGGGCGGSVTVHALVLLLSAGVRGVAGEFRRFTRAMCYRLVQGKTTKLMYCPANVRAVFSIVFFSIQTLNFCTRLLPSCTVCSSKSPAVFCLFACVGVYAH